VHRLTYTLCWLLVAWRSEDCLTMLLFFTNVCFLFIVPYQTAFTYGQSVEFDALYGFGYVLDAVVLYYHMHHAQDLWSEIGRGLRASCVAVLPRSTDPADAYAPSASDDLKRPARRNSDPRAKMNKSALAYTEAAGRRGGRVDARLMRTAKAQHVLRQAKEELRLDQMRQLLKVLIYVPSQRLTQCTHTPKGAVHAR
jgi:hypothetical protein